MILTRVCIKIIVSLGNSEPSNIRLLQAYGFIYVNRTQTINLYRMFFLFRNLFEQFQTLKKIFQQNNFYFKTIYSIGNLKSACLQFYTAKTQAALALPFLPYSTLRVEQCFDSGCLY